MNARVLRSVTGIAVAAFAILLLSAPAVGADDTLKMGVIPLESPKTMYKQFSPLVKYLSEELGVKVELVIGKDYQATMDALAKNEVQFAYLTPTTYPKCRKQNETSGIEPLVRFQVKGKGTYQSCIVVPADSDITGLDQFKGKKFAFGNADSTSSHLMPRAMLIDAGVDIDKDLASADYLGSHTNVALAVKMKKFDGGGVKASVAEDGQKKGDLKILARSKDIPQFPICVNNQLDEGTKGKIRDALLKLKASDNDAKAVLTAINKKYTGCETTTSDDYEVIVGMINSLYGDDFYQRAK